MTDRQPYIVPDEKSRAAFDKQHIRLSYITHYYLNQKKTKTISDLLEMYAMYDSDLLDVIEFVIVDDCSPLQFDIPDYDLNITWLRITDDIMWNQGGARNLGVTYAKSDKILITDLDFEFPEHTLREMVYRRNPGRHFYKIFKKDKQTGVIQKGHANTFFMSRGRFMRMYGYDEEFSGGYGSEDFRFVKFKKYHGCWQHYLPKRFFCHRRIIDHSNSYHFTH